MLGIEKTTKLIEKEVIEVAPLAYLRGRTLNNSFIIMDESQNTTVEQMKMVLTRIGFGSQAVINGDITSGLDHVINVLKETDGIGITRFSSNDVVRHPLVRKIIDAYKKFELNINK
jgi:phosphate starvation-inducible PhoH-like protein